jgi:hypothetical protein
MVSDILSPRPVQPLPLTPFLHLKISARKTRALRNFMPTLPLYAFVNENRSSSAGGWCSWPGCWHGQSPCCRGRQRKASWSRTPSPGTHACSTGGSPLFCQLFYEESLMKILQKCTSIAISLFFLHWKLFWWAAFLL